MFLAFSLQATFKKLIQTPTKTKKKKKTETEESLLTCQEEDDKIYGAIIWFIHIQTVHFHMPDRNFQISISNYCH